MPNQPLSSEQTDNAIPLPPPVGDQKKADFYLAKLIDLINTDKLVVSRTDLSKFDPTSLQDHYRLDLKDYEVEISHNKQPNSGQDFYIILFNNLKHINDSCTEKVILAYIHLSDDQFAKFKVVADDQLERKKKEAEEKRFKEAMTPIDQALEELSLSPQPVEEEQSNIPQTDTVSDNQDTFNESAADSFSNPPSAFTASS